MLLKLTSNVFLLLYIAVVTSFAKHTDYAVGP